VSIYNPIPPVAWVKYPKRTPKRVVPSYMRENGQVLNLLMRVGAGDKLFDFSGEENHGVIYGAKWTDEHSKSWGLSFDGADDYVNIPGSGTGVLDITDDTITLIAWVRLESTDGEEIVGKDDGTPSAQYKLSAETDWRFRANVGGTWQGPTGGSPETGTWYCVAGTYNGSQMVLYVDASVIDTVSVSGNLNHIDNNVMIGAREGGTAMFLNGVVGWVMILARAFSESEVKSFYGDTKPLFVG